MRQTLPHLLRIDRFPDSHAECGRAGSALAIDAIGHALIGAKSRLGSLEAQSGVVRGNGLFADNCEVVLRGFSELAGCSAAGRKWVVPGESSRRLLQETMGDAPDGRDIRVLRGRLSQWRHQDY
jgi:hypothetical protein